MFNKFFWLILFYANLSFSQLQPQAQQKPLLEINFMPLSIFDPTHPQLRFGSELFVLNYLSVGSDFGFGFNPLMSISFLPKKEIFKNYLYLQVRPQVKILFKKSSTFNVYLGAEVFYMKQFATLQNCFAEYSNIFVRFSQANYSKTKFGYNIFFSTKTYTKRSFIEIYLGAGQYSKIAYIYNIVNPTFFNKDNISSFDYKTAFPSDNFYKIFIGEQKYLGITAGIKIGFILIDKKI